MPPISRRSSYSLFPNCSSPVQTPANGNIANIPRRSSSESPRAAAEIDRNSVAPHNTPIDTNRKAICTQSKQSDNMARLIPLKLKSDTRTSLSANLINSSAKVPQQPTSSSTSPKRQRPGPVTDLTILPYTDDEYRKVMEEVKSLFSRGQYKHCSMRCKQILDNVKDPDRVHPLYSIYLSFFAASSLEMTASTLHNHSSNKLPLLQEALSYYQKGQAIVKYETFNTDPTMIHASRRYDHHTHPSISSSVRSSVSSVFSSTSSVNSASSSVSSSPVDQQPTHKRSASASPAARNRKKKVSFSLQLPTLVSEPVTATLDESTLIDAFPNPPSQSPPRDFAPTRTQQLDTISKYLVAQSAHRYHNRLLALSTQLDYHISSIFSQISQLSQARKTRRSNLPNQFNVEGEQVFGIEDVSREEMQKTDLRERIKRLKEAGWKRERFNGERYQILCEKALTEVDDRM